MGQQFPAVVTSRTVQACTPAFCLLTFWIGGAAALVGLAGAAPLGLSLRRYLSRKATNRGSDQDRLLTTQEFSLRLEETLTNNGRRDRRGASICLALDNFDALTDRYGQSVTEALVLRTGDRLAALLPPPALLCRAGNARFSIVLGADRARDLESCSQEAARIMAALERPFDFGDRQVRVSLSIGVCPLDRAHAPTAKDWMLCAATALREAQREGPGSIRVYSEQMRMERASRISLLEQVQQALVNGEIRPWFQPQISTDTGRITGFETLARWDHPQRGLIPPAAFLPLIEETGQLEDLAELMMREAFRAVKHWDEHGLDVPQIGVNFAGMELGNPRLLDRIKWDLDRFELTPDRLAVEVLETVVAAAPDDTITRNINALAALGCRIDLDDFGTGHASLGSIRRFSVSRIKIDRSFISNADRDAEQRRMISAILTMAERLEVETLAEGVETVGEHSVLAQLGCHHVQGYGIARPMPFEETITWIARHNAKLQGMPRILDGTSS
jgi:diguanylate cyclase (GGDEF)-like protein